MAKNTIKGLTVEIGGDTTKLGAALEAVNKKSQDLSQELGQINKLLKLDPGNTDLLAQKQKVLADAVANTREKLDTLKEAERQVQQQFERGEVSEEQVRALQREIIATTNKLDSYERAVRETAEEIEQLGNESQEAASDMADMGGRAARQAADGVEELGDEAEETADDMAEMGDRMDAVASGGFKALTAGAAAAVAALTAAAESTREYRTAMGKLDTAFTTAGHSSEAATETYKTLQGVLGESDQAVEAASHLAKLADNEEELAEWTAIATGVYATFGDSLPIENLTEAANETAKTGALTGGLADALNWAGVNEEAFQAQLDECTTEQERQALITSTLNGLYTEAADKYRETNAEVIAANEANEAWTSSLAAVGEEVEPLLTEVKNLGAELLGSTVPAIKAVADNLPAVAVAASGAAAAVVAFKVAALAAKAAAEGMTLATLIQTKAQAALNVVMNANPVGLIIIAIAALVTAFVLLWNNCEGFRQFWINMWEGLKKAFTATAEAVSTFFTETLPAWFESAKQWLTGIGQWFAKLWGDIVLWFTNLPAKAREGGAKFLQAIVTFFSQLPTKAGEFLGAAAGKIATWVVNTARQAKEAGTQFINNVVTFFKTLPSRLQTWLQNTIAKVTAWATNMAAKAKTAAVNFINNAINTIKALPGKIQTWLQNTISNVIAWGTSLKTRATTAAKNMVTSVVDTVKALPGKMLNIGRDLVEGLWNGIKNAGKWIKDKVSEFTSGILKGFRDNFDINSPSGETEWMGDMLDRGLAKGIEDNADGPLNALSNLSDDMLDEAGGLNGLTLERQLQHTFNPPAAVASAESGLLSKLDRILEAIERGQVLTIDGTALVGSTLHAYDNKLGQRRALAARGAL